MLLDQSLLWWRSFDNNNSVTKLDYSHIPAAVINFSTKFTKTVRLRNEFKKNETFL